MNNHITKPTQTSEKKILWSISGSDCSGGAGIAADIKTGQALGAHVCTLITANTSQNSQGVVAVNPVSVTVLEQQLNTLLVDKVPDAIKVGLIVNAEQLDWLARSLTRLKQHKPNLIVVLDPVGQASVGGVMSTVTKEQLCNILPLVDLLTPNWLEAKNLADSTSNDITAMATSILSYGVKQVVIKGGHCLDIQSSQDNSVSDCANDSAFFYNNDHQLIEYRVSSPRISTQYSHGGGCSFATAMTTLMIQGYLLRDALTLAKAFMQQGFTFNNGLNDSYGPFEQRPLTNNANNFPVVVDKIALQHKALSAFASLNLTNESPHALGLYPVVDSLTWLERLLPLGLAIIQLRLKNVDESELPKLIERAVELAQPYQTRLFINDYWQLAIEYGAYGVHLGQEDLQTANLAAIATADIRLGISTHGCYEFLLAQQLQPSYLAVGAIFPTKTKDMTGQIQGLENLRQILSLKQHIPVVAIGGITLERAQQVLTTKVDAIAVVTAITEADSYQDSVAAFKGMIRAC